MTTGNSLIIAALILAGAIVYYAQGNRYQVAGYGGEGGTGVVLLDRLTGTVSNCSMYLETVDGKRYIKHDCTGLVHAS